jgi:5-methylcytosine-specific restriction protein A
MPTRPKTFKPASSLKVFNAYEANRAPSHKRGYDARWRKLSKWFRMVNPLCALCGAPAEHVDHIEAVSGPADEKFYDSDNLRSLCRSCHSRKTAQQDGGFGRRKS